MTRPIKLTHERNLCEQDLIKLQLQYNTCFENCKNLKNKINELTKKLKGYDKQLAKIRRDSTLS